MSDENGPNRALGQFGTILLVGGLVLLVLYLLGVIG